jgi:hypothetical protein
MIFYDVEAMIFLLFGYYAFEVVYGLPIPRILYSSNEFFSLALQLGLFKQLKFVLNSGSIKLSYAMAEEFNELLL